MQEPALGAGAPPDDLPGSPRHCVSFTLVTMEGGQTLQRWDCLGIGFGGAFAAGR